MKAISQLVSARTRTTGLDGYTYLLGAVEFRAAHAAGTIPTSPRPGSRFLRLAPTFQLRTQARRAAHS